jgi:hypothetical protein
VAGRRQVIGEPIGGENGEWQGVLS